mmetsp:Transcript_127973/g.272904  ORF Transcript_127973/g.272904 Transcript_127973/m.272904 type:complete len:273 (+) Transcript_127973:155-973(+)
MTHWILLARTSIADRSHAVRLPLPCRASSGAIRRQPIEAEVTLKALPLKDIPHQASQVVVVRPVREFQRPAMLEVPHKLLRKALAELIVGDLRLAAINLLILCLPRARLDPLPRQPASVEMHEHVADGLEIVAAALLYAKMRVDARVPGRACQVLVLPVRDVLLRLRVPVLLCKPKVDDVHLVRLLPQADQVIVGLDVPVNEILRVHVLHSVDHLVRQHEHRFQAELAITEAEQVLERRPQQVDDHDIVVTLHTVPVHVRDAHSSSEDLVEL